MASRSNFNQTCQAFFDNLVCKICNTHPKAGKYRWYQCKAQHRICQDCKEIGERNTCQCELKILKNHCSMTEQLLKADDMRFKCANLSRGCVKAADEKSMVSHEKDCIYRLVACPHVACKSDTELVPFLDLMEHLSSETRYSSSHFYEKEYDLRQGEISMNLCMKKGKYENGGFFCNFHKICYDNKVFLFAQNQEYGKETMNFWVQLVGSEYEAKHYYYTLKLQGNDPNANISVTSQVIGIDEPYKSFIKSGKCFGIRFEYFKKMFVDENLNYKFTIGIRNMKEEAKDDNMESGISDNDD